ncbi:hypothetical protein E3E36_05120 [Thermococcus sp. M36]|uniref:hypothetical protein n=1 Tax=Thermococcus sp. M36 TaxID=1638261 RepID=UPI001438CC8F|nr:hypothetical protein [Thermococcus sp. M36]NJE05532.1 hypothetical protein [Thermococcus sp. M36]
MGYLSETLRREYSDLAVRDVYSTKLGDTDIEIIEVSKDDKKFIAMFQSHHVKENLFRWSLIITSAKHTRTLKGMDTVEGIELALKSSVEAMIAGMKE